jgi:hypothetical protein
VLDVLEEKCSKVAESINIAQVRKTVMQMQVNSTLYYIGFGTIAGLRRFSRPTRRIKAGMIIMVRDRRMTFGTCQIVEVLDIIIAETYESIAIHALAIKTPTQSISIANLFSQSCPAKDVGMAEKAAIKIILFSPRERS